ncbi:MAG: hypothetical protein K2L28_08955, partial [Muribaculaceae bacterium]|nr:hypothetical protein [Muribaculaceae bacterium]
MCGSLDIGGKIGLDIEYIVFVERSRCLRSLVGIAGVDVFGNNLEFLVGIGRVVADIRIVARRENCGYLPYCFLLYTSAAAAD